MHILFIVMYHFNQYIFFKLYPITNFDDPDINIASDDLINSHANKFATTSRFLGQVKKNCLLFFNSTH